VCAIYFKFPQGGISKQASIQSISENYLRHDTIENAWVQGGANEKRNAGNRSKAGTRKKEMQEIDLRRGREKEKNSNHFFHN
jgi:hypothetical protein